MTKSNKIKGRVHSFQSLGTLDGPGVRFVVFMQGCPLRCRCCHNPDTWEYSDGEEYTPIEILEKVTRCREYFGEKGGITLSGGEPLLQAEFARELFSLSHSEGINTCLDTAGIILNDDVRELLSLTDRVLLDIKYTTDKEYIENTGAKLAPVLEFLAYLNEKGIKTTLRQVIIPTLNDNEENIRALAKIASEHPVVDKVELLPFKKICESKYDALGIPFPLKDIPTPTKEKMAELNEILKDQLAKF